MFSDRHLFCSSIFNRHFPFQRFIISSAAKGIEPFSLSGLFCFWFFFSPGLGNGCRMNFNQEPYQTSEAFLEIHQFLYVLQALGLMLFVGKGHSMAEMLFSFPPNWPVS